MKPITEEWLNRAREDLDVALLISSWEDLTNIVYQERMTENSSWKRYRWVKYLARRQELKIFWRWYRMAYEKEMGK